MSIQERAYMGCYMDIFQFDCRCACVRVRYIGRHANSSQTPQRRTYKTPFVFLLAVWSGFDYLFYAFVMFFPSVFGHFCYVCSKPVSVGGACVRGFLTFCFRLTISVSGTCERAWLFFRSASTVKGLILCSNQAIWSLQSDDVQRRMG